jgi:DNA repair protein RadC
MKHTPLKLVVEDRFSALHPEDLREEEADSVVRLALEVLASRYRPGELLTSPQEVRAYLQLRLAGQLREVFACVFLDNRHRVLGFEELFFGSIGSAEVHPRIVVQRALALNSAAVILAHTHPSGVAEPSRADEMITERLKEALALVEVRVLDHVVIAAIETVSFAERGLL